MTRFLNDQAKLVYIWESGTYGNPSGNGVWPGLVQSHEITEMVNVIQTRFLGQGNRNIGRYDDGPLDVEGTITLFPQDWRFIGLALGSIGQSSTALNFANHFAEVNGGQRMSPNVSGYFNPWTSFSLEESRTGNVTNKNSVRTIRGCVPNEVTLNITQGEPIEMQVGFIGQIGSWFSGATTTVTAGSNRPYMWSDTTFQLPQGTTMEPVKSLNLTITNNFERAHYINGSQTTQVPYPLNRDYTLEITQDLDANVVGSLYNSFFQGGSLFNCVLDIDSSSAVVGSHRLNMTFSGCIITEMSEPVEVGGISEVSYTIMALSGAGSAWDRYAYTLF